MSIDLASELVRLGITQSELASRIKVHKSQITRWTKWGMPIPPERAAKIEETTGIPKHQLRPDHFEAPASEEA
jgi:DNA-binding transcriptional regulator YdaS (Cro superfamily)